MLDWHQVGWTVGERAALFLTPWRNRLGTVLFLFFWWRWGFWPAIFVAAISAGVIWWKNRAGTGAEEQPDTTHGSARWANLTDLFSTGNATLELDPNRYLLGLPKETLKLKKNVSASLIFSHGRRGTTSCLPLITTGTKDASLGNVDDGHCLTVAGPGAGKGIAVVQPNLMLYSGSTIVFDPKGENFLKTGAARLALGQRLCLVDPFNALPEALRATYTIRFNPLQPLNEFYQAGRHSDVIDEAGAIADLMVLTTENDSHPHFNEKAKAFIRAAILFVTYADIYQNREKYPLNLVTVMDAFVKWFSSAEKMTLLTEMCNENPYLKSVAGTVSMIAREERGSVLSAVLKHTEFLDSPNVRESLSASDFSLSDLKRQRMSVYLVLPANLLKAYSRLGRLWIGTFLRAMMSDTTQPRQRVLFMLDEIAQLGTLEPLLQAVSLGRGYGLDVWMVFQNIHQMKTAYKESWQSLISDTKYKQFFGIRDLETAEYLSNYLGKQTITKVSCTSSQSKTTGTNSGHSFGGMDGNSTSSRGTNVSTTRSDGYTIDTMGRELLTPDEVMRLPETDLLILMANRHPVLAEKYDIRLPVCREVLTAALPSMEPTDLHIPAAQGMPALTEMQRLSSQL